MKSDSLIRRDVGDEILILDLQSSRIHRLNATASRICRLSESGLHPEAIADELVEHFSVEDCAALQDVENTLRELSSLGVLGPLDERYVVPPDARAAASEDTQ